MSLERKLNARRYRIGAAIDGLPGLCNQHLHAGAGVETSQSLGAIRFRLVAVTGLCLLAGNGCGFGMGDARAKAGSL